MLSACTSSSISLAELIYREEKKLSLKTCCKCGTSLRLFFAIFLQMEVERSLSTTYVFSFLLLSERITDFSLLALQICIAESKVKV